jgi:hypothetical protein
MKRIACDLLLGRQDADRKVRHGRLLAIHPSEVQCGVAHCDDQVVRNSARYGGIGLVRGFAA